MHKIVDVKNVYDNKMRISQRDDFNNLIDKINKEDPEIKIKDGYNRTLLIDYNNSNNSIDSFQDIFGRALRSWMIEEISCPIKYTYNLFKLNEKQFIIKI